MTFVRALLPLFAVGLLVFLGYVLLTPKTLERVPDISLGSIDGRTVELARMRGHPLLVTFWATTCESCVAEIPHLAALYREFHPRGLEIVAISMDYDPPNRVIALSEKQRIPYTVALDIRGTAAEAFGNVRVTPTSFLVDREGHVDLFHVGKMNIAALRARIVEMLEARAAGSAMARGGSAGVTSQKKHSIL
jgi:peroxiredoxin